MHGRCTYALQAGEALARRTTMREAGGVWARWRERFGARSILRRAFGHTVGFYALAVALGDEGQLWRLVRKLYFAWIRYGPITLLHELMAC